MPFAIKGKMGMGSPLSLEEADGVMLKMDISVPVAVKLHTVAMDRWWTMNCHQLILVDTASAELVYQ